MEKTRRAFMVWRKTAISTLYEYDRFLETQKDRYAPVTKDEEWSKPFTAALREKDTVALYLHILQHDPPEEQILFYKQAKERIKQFGKQMEQYQRADDGRSGAGYATG